MEEVFYNILWIDDEHETLQGTKGRAKRNGINLIPFKSLNGGMDELERNSLLYDGVLLDAKFFKNEDDTKGTEDTDYVHRAKERLLQLPKKFEIFILTGQAEAYEDKTFKKAFTKVYKKGSDDEVNQLFSDIKEAAAKQEDTQLKYKYADLVETCSEHLLGPDQFKRLFTLIKHVEDIQKLSSPEDKLLPIRKIIERMFTRMMEKGIIPEAISFKMGWITASSLFLENKHPDYEHVSEIASPLICENFHRLLNITQDAAHGDGNLKLEVDQYLIKSQSDYLYRSCVFLLFDLLLWFKVFMESNKDVAQNKARWILKNQNWITGTLTHIAENGWGTFLPDRSQTTISIPPKMVADNELNENDIIKIITEPRTITYIKAISKGP